MRQKRDDQKAVEKAVHQIKRRTRRNFSPEEKIRIVLQGLRGEDSIAELCRREGLSCSVFGPRTFDPPSVRCTFIPGLATL